MTKFIRTDSKLSAVATAPWACKYVRVEGGFMAFKTMADYKLWKNQK